MAPISRDSQAPKCEQRAAAPAPEPELAPDAIVVSGMSGLFPQAPSVRNFSELLYNKVNPVSNENLPWSQKHPEANDFIGRVPGLERFDSQFFMVHHRLANAMDPMARKVLEQAYQAIYDAGVSPKHLYGKKVGVYISAGFSDTEKFGLIEYSSPYGYGLTGVSKTMFPNRVSYWLNTKGPSMTFDADCCGAIVALEEAVRAIRSGAADSAIVGGASVCLAPHSLVHYNRCIKLSPDGKTRSFDQHADGCCKSEAISVLFLQKAKDALRAYAEVVHVSAEFTSRLTDVTGQSFGFIRAPAASAAFLRSFYSQARVPPTAVHYVEACGTANPEADKAELQSIEAVFCEDRSDPVQVGSVISNVGLTDAAAGVVALTKVLLAYHTGVVASNLHCSEPRRDVHALQDGRMCVLTEHAALQGRYAAVNCLSFTGINGHVLLRGCAPPKDPSRYATSLPRLVTVSARQQEFIHDIFRDLKSRPVDAEELALLHNIHSTKISGHLGRGYIILDTNSERETVCLAESVEYADESKRPLWFVYSGMGSQWAGMGAQLMRVPIFAAAIERCDRVLKPQGIDIVHILTTPDKKIFDNVLNSFVGIAAVQIGLTDVLTALGLRPDNIIGHSVGELGCAYADGCLTAEEMILAACSRGRASNAASLPPGAMAAVGLGYQQVRKLIPPSIDVACHNSAESCTISGPVEAVRAVVASLAANGVFAKEVPSANIAYHSRYIAAAGPHLSNLLMDVISKPKLRSERWVSTSVPQDKWDEPAAKYCSAEYFTNNLLNSVLFEETASLIPPNAVLVEVAPHGLLQAILKRALPASVLNLPLTRRGQSDNVTLLLNAVGKLYIAGYEPQLAALYPAVQFPVSAGTPHLAHHVRWFHDETWSVIYGDCRTKKAASRSLIINIHDEEYSYLTGNVVQGVAVFPWGGALEAAWDTLCMSRGVERRGGAVRFRDVHLYAAPALYDQKHLALQVTLHRGNGRFEVSEGESKVAIGYIESIEEQHLNDVEDLGEYNIDGKEVYSHLAGLGYSYSGVFRSVERVEAGLLGARVKWHDSWPALLEALLQLHALRAPRAARLAHVRELSINVREHAALLRCVPELTAHIDVLHERTRCGGVVAHGMKLVDLPGEPENFQLISEDTTSDGTCPTIQTELTGEKNYVLQIANVGDVESLHWEETTPTPTSLGVPVRVEFAGINMSDVGCALGSLPAAQANCGFGMDFSGITDNGTRVMGLVRGGAASTRVVARPELLWPVPPHWTLAEAATVPLAYCQALYYLVMRCGLQRGASVLVQGAAGALGQAAVAVALAHGARVFATVSNAAKKRFLLKLFPELDESDVGNSRDDTFGDMVLAATRGARCDIVLSCARDDLGHVSQKCSGPYGYTVDLVHYMEKADKTKFGMFNLTDERSYVTADFYSVLDNTKSADFERLHALVSSGIASGVVRPLTHVSYAPQHAARAFRLLAAARHRGRALLALRDRAAPVTPRMVCSPGRVHVMLWDGSPLGLQLAGRLVARGARSLRVLCLRRAPAPSLQLRLWREAGADVVLETFDEADDAAVAAAVSELAARGELEGLYVVAADAAESASFERQVRLVDAATRETRPPLNYFCVLSLGDTLGADVCRERRVCGLHALALTLPEDAEGASVTSAVERAACGRAGVVRAQAAPAPAPCLRDVLPALAEARDNTATLRQLGLEEWAPALQAWLSARLHVWLDVPDVLELSAARISEMVTRAKEPTFEDVSGLSTFFTIESRDELRATSELVPISTLAQDVDTVMGGVDARRAHLFVVPGLEGQYARFTELCARLKVPAVVLQPSLDRPKASPADQASRYAQILLGQFKLKNDFYLLGYEFGVEVALELAAILEDHGLVGTVFCLGDGPEELRALLRRELAAFPDEAALQEALVRHMCSLLAPGAPISTSDAPCTRLDWTQRVEAAVHALCGVTPHTAQYVRATLNAAYERLQLARAELPAPRALRSRVVALRARDTGAPRAACSLQRYSAAPLTLHELASPLAHAARDLRGPALVNKYLAEELRRQFDESNSCITYVL